MKEGPFKQTGMEEGWKSNFWCQSLVSVMFIPFRSSHKILSFHFIFFFFQSPLKNKIEKKLAFKNFWRFFHFWQFYHFWDGMRLESCASYHYKLSDSQITWVKPHDNYLCYLSIQPINVTILKSINLKRDGNAIIACSLFELFGKFRIQSETKICWRSF